jgi:hypothetical protein
MDNRLHPFKHKRNEEIMTRVASVTNNKFYFVRNWKECVERMSSDSSLQKYYHPRGRCAQAHH